jgi:hypothetical protein
MWIKSGSIITNMDHIRCVTIKDNVIKLWDTDNSESFRPIEFENISMANREFKKIYDALRVVHISEEE